MCMHTLINLKQIISENNYEAYLCMFVFPWSAVLVCIDPHAMRSECGCNDCERQYFEDGGKKRD